MHGTDRGPRVQLSTAVGPTIVAVGAVAHLAGEISAVDGRVYVSAPDGAGGTATTAEAGDVAAALLVHADVRTWHPVPLKTPVDSARLADAVEAALRDAGFDLEQAIPIRMRGELREVAWHVIDGARLEGTGHAAHRRSGPHGVLESVEGSLVGFFSRHHPGVFTHMNERLHLHLIRDVPEPLTAHVDGAGLASGVVLEAGLP